jgi:GTP-binding protein HflX
VGFISDLPPQLVAAFRATLEEVLAADLICHVRDIAHPGSDEQAQDVRAILADLGVDASVPVLEVWNKLDLLRPEARGVAEALAARTEGVQVLSALTGEGMEALVAKISEVLDGARAEETLDIAFADGRSRAWLHDQGIVEREEERDEGWRVTVHWTPKQRAKFREIGGAAEARSS